MRAIRRAKVQGKQGARFRRAGPRSERKMSLPRTRRYPRLCPPHGDSQGAKPTRDGTMAGTPADHGASTNEGAGTSESASATTTNEPASETPSSSDSDSDSDSDSSIELPEWTHLETPTTGTCPLCLGRRTLPWSAHDQRTSPSCGLERMQALMERHGDCAVNWKLM